MSNIYICTLYLTNYPLEMSNILLKSCACRSPIITVSLSRYKKIVDNSINCNIIKQEDCRSLIDRVGIFLSI